MLGESLVPNTKAAGFVRFYGATETVNASGEWVTWAKPQNASLIIFTCISGGGGGSGGAGGLAGTARYGGPGGGGGAIGSMIIPAIFLPRLLYLRPGHGGIGGVGNNTTTPVLALRGSPSYVCEFPLATHVFGNTIIASSTGLNGGGHGNNPSGGSSDTGPQLTLNSAYYHVLGTMSGRDSLAGRNAPASGAAGVDCTPISAPTMGGASGGSLAATNIDRAGGGLAMAGSVIGGLVSVPGGAAGGGDGAHGIRREEPFYNTAGLGGGTNASGTGGRGGDGAIGTGGGGGGAGLIGGNGGNGGPGMILIAWM